jgi:hypothetical protein
MPGNEATHAFYTTEPPKAVEKTLRTPGLRCQIRVLAIERGDNSPPRFSTKMQIQGRYHRPAVVPGQAAPTYTP